MSAYRIRSKAKTDRGDACLSYIQKRSTPVTVKEMADKLKINPRLVQNVFDVLLDEGKVTRTLIRVQSSLAKKPAWSYGYNAIDHKPQTRNRKLAWNNPFNLGGPAA
jgi:predicted ArsR family transcriptional regulator